ncbi:MAG: RNA-binding S4 domain-containing protein [Desulfamplus sp.]|nr:RNA-binding S4 domain-containing protein [Desulfamplus sp.]MBF0257830.1 RNA-binding S4 domain-containing protein [Desulfamplus sp.]
MKSVVHRLVSIEQEPVELCKILKFENLVLSGGEAKHAIKNGMVLVNGFIEKRKRKKIFAGDIVEFNGETMELCKIE